MKTKLTITRQAGFSLIILTVIIFIGCAPKVRIKASDSMIKENPMKEIAVVADGRIEWPRILKKEPVMGLVESKKALEILLPQIRKNLTQKGYKVTFCEAAGIGYYRYKEGWVIDTETDKQWQITNSDPAYVYPIAQNNPEFGAAVRNLFSQTNKFITYRFGENPPGSFPEISYVPKETVNVIQKVTGGDTICLTRIHGQKFSAARKAVLSTLNVLVAVTGRHISSPDDTLVAHFTCIDAKNGEILLQYGIPKKQNPVDPSETYIDEGLSYFPEINKPVDPKYISK